MKELLLSYTKGEVTAINVIRQLSGIVIADQAINVLALICMITRVEEGDLEMDLFKELVGLKDG